MNTSLSFGHTLKKEKETKGVNKTRKARLEQLDERERVKYEIAEELGLLDRVLNQGWKSLTSKETGRIGGLVTKRLYRKESAKDKSKG